MYPCTNIHTYIFGKTILFIFFSTNFAHAYIHTSPRVILFFLKPQKKIASAKRSLTISLLCLPHLLCAGSACVRLTLCMCVSSGCVWSWLRCCVFFFVVCFAAAVVAMVVVGLCKVVCVQNSTLFEGRPLLILRVAFYSFALSSPAGFFLNVPLCRCLDFVFVQCVGFCLR